MSTLIGLYEMAIDKTASEDIVDVFSYLRDALEQDLGRMYVLLKMESHMSEKSDRETK